MSNIPEEYSNFDFGFTAVDEPPKTTTEPPPPTIDENDINRAVLNSMEPVENRLDEIISLVQALNQKKIIEEEHEVQTAVEQAKLSEHESVAALEEIIMPLLVNLIKTADKDYIYWPNRAAKVQETIDRVLAITRS